MMGAMAHALLMATLVATVSATTVSVSTFEELKNAVSGNADRIEMEVNGDMHWGGTFPDHGSVVVGDGKTVIIRGTSSNDQDRFTLDSQHDAPNAHHKTRFFDVNVGGTLELSNLELVNGAAFGQGANKGRGGAVYNEGTFTSTNCEFRGNTASGRVEDSGNDYGEGFGGAVYNSPSGTFTATDCKFSDNTATATGGAQGVSYGGAVYNSGSPSTFTATNCNFSGNSASQGGGDDIHAQTGGSVVLRSCSFSNSGTITGGAPQGCLDPAIDDWCSSGTGCRAYDNSGSSWGVYCMSASLTTAPSASPTTTSELDASTSASPTTAPTTSEPDASTSASPSASPTTTSELDASTSASPSASPSASEQQSTVQAQNKAAPRTGAAFALLLSSTSVLLLHVC